MRLLTAYIGGRLGGLLIGIGLLLLLVSRGSGAPLACGIALLTLGALVFFASTRP